jgi:hypothetical protein
MADRYTRGLRRLPEANLGKLAYWRSALEILHIEFEMVDLGPERGPVELWVPAWVASAASVTFREPAIRIISVLARCPDLLSELEAASRLYANGSKDYLRGLLPDLESREKALRFLIAHGGDAAAEEKMLEELQRCR